ncbi:MAG TPA: DUF885 domain-containing protein [Candidatus Dormibacteraeota bacterium]|nr:DUF885 domain-containing protein [Candidatus Dormibacteraeota bacterium]
MSKVDEIAHDFLKRNADLDPNEASGRGLLGHDAELTDYSPSGEEARAELARATLRQIEGIAPESERDRLASAVMRDRLQAVVDVHDSGDWMRGLHVFGPTTIASRVFDLMATEDDHDWELIVERMEKVPECVKGSQATLELGASRNVVSARHQAVICAERARTWAGTDSNPGFFRTLAAGYTGPSQLLRSRLTPAAVAADQAYLHFAEYVEGSYLGRASDREGCGSELYQLNCRVYNGIEIDGDQTYQWGWEELGRIQDEMDRTADRIVPGGSLAEVTHLLETDPARAIEGEANFLAWNQSFLDETMAALNSVHFDIPEPVQRVEAMLAPPGGSPAMYYTPPAEDFSRPGRTWYPTLGRTHFPLWMEIATAYHEGVPGHHLQLGHICWLGDRLNPFQGLLGLISGHAEGWALYAERLMGELGYLENPDYYLGMLANQAFRAARVVVDIGLHLQLRLPENQPFHPGEVWSRELAVDFMTLCSGRAQEFCAGEVDRYLGIPAQAISYKLGERVWLEVREEARRTWGPRFSLKEFHRQALDLGSVGLQQLREEMVQPRSDAVPAD